MFYQQLIALCEREGIKPTPLIKSLGFSAGNIKRWENGATVNSDILLAVSRHFKVSIDYLLTGEEYNSQININNSGSAGAVGHTINGTINISHDNITYGDNSEKNVLKEKSATSSNDEMTNEMLRIFKELPFKARTKIMNTLYEFEEEYSKKK